MRKFFTNRALRIEQIRALASTGNSASQIASELGIGEEQVRKIAKAGGLILPADSIGKRRMIDPLRVVEQIVIQVAGCAEGLELVGDLRETLSPAAAAELLANLLPPMKALARLKSTLKEIASVNER